MVTDTTAAYTLLLNGSIFPAVNSYYNTILNGYFWGSILIVILMVLFIKTKSPITLFTAATIGSTILYLTGLSNRGTMGILLLMIVFSGGSMFYTWLAK